MSILETARKTRAAMEIAAVSLDDLTASIAPDMFPRLKQDGSLISVGTRINWNGTVKKTAVDLWDTVENNPDNAPTLWADLDYKDGIRFIPKVITVTTAFTKGERGWWKDELYESLIDNNVWTPDAYPAGWAEVIFE